MANSEGKYIEVWADWQWLKKATLMGHLSTTLVRGKEIFAFLCTTQLPNCRPSRASG
jgi:hypothetical protein